MAVWSLYTELLEDALSREGSLGNPDRSALVAAVAERRTRLSQVLLADGSLMERLAAELAYDLALIHLARSYGLQADPRSFANPDRFGRTNPAAGRRRLEDFLATQALIGQVA